MTVRGWLIVLFLWSLLAGAFLVLSVMLTNPQMLGPIGVTVWFVGLFLTLSAIITLGLFASKSYLRLHATGANRLRYCWRQGILLSGWIVGILGLSSLQQLGLLDAILLGMLLLIVEVYMRFRWP